MFDPKYPEPDPNKKQAKDVWEKHYGEESYLFGKEPISLLKSYVGVLKKGKALDVAMGEGRNAVYLAEQGFNVTGLDVSAKAVEKAKKLGQEKNTPIDAKVQNLDFFLMKLMHWDTILMCYYRPQPRFFSEILRGLVHKGTFAMEAYTVDHYKNQNPPNPTIEFEDCYKPNEVLRLLKGFRILYYKEMQDGNAHIVQAIAQKLQRWSFN